MKIGDICNHQVIVVKRNASILEVVGLMRNHHVGDVIVVDEQDGRRIPIGVLTDRDIVIEILAEDVDVNAVNVGDVMSYELLTGNKDDEVFDTIKSMQVKGVRRLPVVDSHNDLVGILTLDDLLEFLTGQMGDLVKLVAREQTHELISRS